MAKQTRYTFEYEGHKYTVEGPEGLSDDDLISGIADYGVPTTSKAPMSATKFTLGNLLEGAGQALDALPFNMGGNSIGVTGDIGGVQTPDPEQDAYLKNLEQGHPVTSQALRAAGGSMVPAMGPLGPAGSVLQRARNVAVQGAVGGAFGGGQGALNQMGDIGEIGAILLPFAPTAGAMATKAYLGARLARSEARANPPREAEALKGAKAALPNNLTIGQTTQSAGVRGFARSVAGRAGEVASANQLEKIGDNLAKQAGSIAAVPLKSPKIASNITYVLQKYEGNIKTMQANSWNAGVAKVKALQKVSPANVTMDNLLAAHDSIRQQGIDIFKLAPTQLSPETTRLLEFLSGRTQDNGTRLKTLKPLGAMQVGKALNELYDAAPQGALTPAMDQAFKQLKQAYQKDIDANVNGPVTNQALIAMKQTNSIYSKLSDKRDKLRGSVVNGVLGRDGIRDPDKALDAIRGQAPEAQAYTRRILEAYDHDTLQALRAYSIEKHVNEAVNNTRGYMQGKYDPQKLAPQALVESGLFTKAQANQLADNQHALNVILQMYIRQGKGDTVPGLQGGGRMVGGVATGAGGSMLFVAGAAAKAALTGPMDRFLNTPEGRNALRVGAYGSGKAAVDARKLVLSVINIASQEEQARNGQGNQ